MKRYLIFGAIGPFLGGFLLLFASTVAGNYWAGTGSHSVGQLLSVFVKSLPYYYLFGLVPVMIYAAIDDIIAHIHKIGPVIRMLMTGTVSFFGSVLLYGFQGDAPSKQKIILVGLAGLVPGLVASWLSRTAEPHKPRRPVEQLTPK